MNLPPSSSSVPPETFRTVLVFPSNQGSVQSLFTFHKEEGIGAKPPLGIVSLATVLRKGGFLETHCLDAQREHLTPEQTVAALQGRPPHVIGITIWTDFWFPAWRTVELARQAFPESIIVLGGPHCSVFPKETMEASSADFLVVGDGEETFLNLVRGLAKGERNLDLPGLWRRGPDGIQGPSIPVAFVSNLEALPWPDRRLLPFEKYYSLLNPSDFETTMVTSRGCPHRCIFCKVLGQKVASRSAQSVIREFQDVVALGIRDIQIYDDTFTWSKQRVMDICQGILDARLDVRWAIRDRVNRADLEMYHAMRKAGCYRIHFGIESGSRRILETSQKGITLEEARRAISLAQTAGFTTLAYYMFGFPSETRNDAMATIRFAREIASDYALFAVLIPYPGTQLYIDALKNGAIQRDFWRDFARHPTPDFFIPHLMEDHMTRKELISLKDRALFSYYFRPKRFFREISNLTSVKELWRKFSMAKNILQDFLSLS